MRLNAAKSSTARWLLANMLDWHRREEKAAWWELFRLSDLSEEELLDERPGLSGLVFEGVVGGTKKAPIHRYRFAPQETEIRGEEDLRAVGGARYGKVVEMSAEQCFLDIKKRQDSADLHAGAVFAHQMFNTGVHREALLRIGEFVAEYGMEGEGRIRPLAICCCGNRRRMQGSRCCRQEKARLVPG